MLNLSVKLFLTNPTQTELLCQYVFNLARYDPNYDIRDRARFLKQFVFPAAGQPNVLTRNAKLIFLAAKPAPQLESKYQGREQFQLGSLSHYLNVRATGYHDIPDFPEVPTDSSVRNVESPTPGAVDAADDRHVPIGQHTEAPSAKAVPSKSKVATKKGSSFYSESDDKSSSEYQSSESSSESEETTNAVVAKAPIASVNNTKKHSKKTESSESESSSSDSEEDSSSSSSSEEESSSDGSSESADSSDDEEAPEKTFQKAKQLATNLQPSQNGAVKKVAEKSNLDLLLDLDDIAPVGPVMTPSMGGFLTPMTSNQGFTPAMGAQQQRIDLVGPTFIPLNHLELINKNSGNGLSVRYRFTRAPHLYSAAMVSIELAITNGLEHDLNDLRLDAPVTNHQIKEFASIAQLTAGATTQALIGIEFNDSTQPIHLAIGAASFSSAKATLKPPVGELVRSVVMSEAVFVEERAKLRGMNEHSAQLQLTDPNKRLLQKRIFEYANVAAIPSSDATNRLNFAGQTFGSKSLVLLTVEFADESATTVTVNVACEKMVIGSMLLTELRAFLLNV